MLVLVADSLILKTLCICYISLSTCEKNPEALCYIVRTFCTFNFMSQSLCERNKSRLLWPINILKTLGFIFAVHFMYRIQYMVGCLPCVFLNTLGQTSVAKF